MEDELLYKGRFDHVGDRKFNSVRVFVSSTFTDTTEERNGLIDRVYPRLREYCLAKYNIQFQYSDMRWGIQSTASNTHTTVDMCLQELDICYRLSMATNCVVLLSHRYGSRFAPAWISSRIFECLLSKTEEKTFLSQMYQLDENYLERRYFLRPVDNDQQWNESEKKLQTILRKAADSCYEQRLITKDERDEFHISVTAQEIYRALKNNNQKPRRLLCFFRELTDISDLESKFRDSDDRSEFEQSLSELKKLLHQSVDSSEIYTYKLRWNDEHARKEYLAKFFDDFYQAVKSQVDFHLQIYENKRQNIFYNQVLEHAIQCNLLTQRFFPRPELFQQIKAYVMSSTNHPCVLLGESGTGKSSIMAKLVKEIPTWYPQGDSVSVIVRFLGATPSSSDIRRPLISIVEQICLLYHLPVPSSFDNVKEVLENVLKSVPSGQHLILLFDSIDQLQMADLDSLSKWLPETFPSSNIKCIFSTIASIEVGYERRKIDIHEQLKEIYKTGLTEFAVEPFDENTAEQVLHSWLEQDQRRLTATQYEWLKPKLARRNQVDPLFLALLYDQTLTWHSYDQVPDKAFLAIDYTGDAIEYLYNQLSLKHGEVLFQRSMRYIQLSGGLSELEIEDILSSDDEVLQSVFVYYLPPLKLFRLPSNLWIRIRNDMHKYLIEKDIDGVPCVYFYHRSFQEYRPWKGGRGIAHSRQMPILEKIRLEYFADQYKTTFDMSYSPKLMKKYDLPTAVISVDRCLTEQQPLQRKKNGPVNFRRLHQLYINIGRYTFVHHLTVFNLEFLLVLLLCGEYKLSDLLYEFTMMNFDGDGESRFLIKQFETALPLLNQYPNNLPFELVYRLLPFRDQLAELTSKLLEQCLVNCPLQLITDDERQQCLMSCPVSNIVYSKMAPFSLFVLTDDGKMLRFNNHHATKMSQFDIVYKKRSRQDKLVSALYGNGYICCLTSNSEMIVVNMSTKAVTMQIPCDRLLACLKNETVLIVSASGHALQIWKCFENLLLSEYDFPDDVIEDCVVQKALVKVTLKLSKTVSYFSIDDTCQIKFIRTVNGHTHHYQHRILLDIQAEFYYSSDSSKCMLVIDREGGPYEIHDDIDFLAPPKLVVYLPQTNSIAWLTHTSLMVFHPLYKENVFEPFSLPLPTDTIEYDVIHDNYSSVAFSGGLGNLLACIDKAKGIIDIYEWLYQKKEQKHISVLLAHVQLDMHIEHCVFEAENPDGITMFCSDGKTLYKHNVTMLSYLLASKRLVASETILQTPATHLDQFVTYTDNHDHFKVLTLNDNNQLDLHLSIQSVKECYFTRVPSHVLVINRRNALFIYSLKTTKLLWQTNEFEHRKLQIHPLRSSFVLVCPQTRQVFEIDTKLFKIKNLVQLPVDCLISIVTSGERLFVLSKDQTTVVEFNITNQSPTSIASVQLDSGKIIQMYLVCNCLVFHAYDGQVYLWRREGEAVQQLEVASNLAATDKQFVLVSTDHKALVFYDLEAKSRKTAELDEDAGECEVLCFSNVNKEDHERYLFMICHDRLLRMYRVSDGQQLVKLFINKDLYPFIGILNDRLLLKVANRLCIIKIIDRKSQPSRLPDTKCTLFEQTYWLRCHNCQFA